ncbi:type-F conjugative transfer system protein TrbI [bacterium]|nr:type-F conjugative transfer system protein TrbI [bacterium]
MFRLYAMLAVVGIVGAVLFGAWYEYRDMQQRIATLRENNAKLETVAKANAEALEEVTAFANQMEASNLELQANLQKAEAYKDDLLSKFQKHNLTKLSLRKPGLIEGRINDATKKVFDDIESLTAITND